MREIELRLIVGRTPNHTALRIFGRILQLRHRPNEALLLMRMLPRKYRFCLVLPVDAPWSWLDFWARQVEVMSVDRLCVRFAVRGETDAR